MLRGGRARMLALGLCVLACPSCENPAKGPSDYPLYSAVLDLYVEETSAERVLIRHVAAVDDFADQVYAAADLRYYVEAYPNLAGVLPDLFRLGRVRMAERPTLADSFQVSVSHALLPDSTFAELRSMPFMRAVELADSTFGPAARIACLTPPARVGDQAVVFLASTCFERNALVGALYFLERDAEGWRVIDRSPWSEN